jgi:WD40 repeat protein
MILWDVATKHPLRPAFGAEGGLLCVAFSPDGKQVAYGGDELSVTVYDVAADRGWSFLVE